MRMPAHYNAIAIAGSVAMLTILALPALAHDPHGPLHERHQAPSRTDPVDAGADRHASSASDSFRSRSGWSIDVGAAVTWRSHGVDESDTGFTLPSILEGEHGYTLRKGFALDDVHAGIEHRAETGFGPFRTRLALAYHGAETHSHGIELGAAFIEQGFSRPSETFTTIRAGWFVPGFSRLLTEHGAHSPFSERPLGAVALFDGHAHDLGLQFHHHRSCSNGCVSVLAELLRGETVPATPGQGLATVRLTWRSEDSIETVFGHLPRAAVTGWAAQGRARERLSGHTHGGQEPGFIENLSRFTGDTRVFGAEFIAASPPLIKKRSEPVHAWLRLDIGRSSPDGTLSSSGRSARYRADQDFLHFEAGTGTPRAALTARFERLRGDHRLSGVNAALVAERAGLFPLAEQALDRTTIALGTHVSDSVRMRVEWVDDRVRQDRDQRVNVGLIWNFSHRFQ